MATVSFEVRSNSENANIYVRVSIDRKNVYRRKSGYLINPKNWSPKTKQPIQRDESLKRLKSNLDKFKIRLTDIINNALETNVHITGHWIQEQIDLIHGKVQPKALDVLVNYFDEYIRKLPLKATTIGSDNKSSAAITKYKTIKQKIIDFQDHTGKTFLVKDVGVDFRDKFVSYLKDIDKLGLNTIGRYIRFLKTVCRDAKINGIETHFQLDAVKGFTKKAEKIILTFDEIESIQGVDLQREALINARDWLIIGCYIGQRVSDLLTLTNENLVSRNGLHFIELIQKKTGKIVEIPIHPVVEEILEKKEGNFPYKISAQRFNEYIKDVGRIAGLTSQIKGGKFDKETKRKNNGVYQKWELITSHVCRRSFATNFYGDYPTPLLMQVTGHSTEKQFLEYIGKPELNHAQQLAEFWAKEARFAKKKTHLKIVKTAK
ncbi:phage integrase SAM-like domain-containing protein [Marinifilum flexuosum]|nr:phage integrase SAM-like domain-containing protein [Marinifilum flexuosum]